MRAKLAIRHLRRASRTSPIAGASAIAGASRSLRRARREWPADAARDHRGSVRPRGRVVRPGESVSLANTSRVASATPGLTSTANSGGRPQRRPQPLADAAPSCARARSRQTGTSAPVAARGIEQPRIVGRDAVGPREQPQRRRRVGGAAAEPGRDRQALDERETPEPQVRRRCGASAWAALSTRLSSRRAAMRGGRPAHGRAQGRSPARASARRRRRRRRRGFRARDSRRRAGPARAASG